MRKNKMPKFWLAISLLTGLGALSGCNNTTSTSKPNSTSPSTQTSTPIENIGVTEVMLELSKQNAKIGEIITANVKIKPSNATNKEFTLSSSDTTIAKITKDNKIECLARGTVTITARSVSNPTKKAEGKLVVLGSDEEGRYENVFEAENAHLVGSAGSSIGTEAVDDDRLSGTGVVGKLSKGDRIIWGINADEADTNAKLQFRLMGPSGWLGMWDSIPYTFADFYTVKVNGKVINTEDVHVEGTLNRGGSADYYNVKDVVIGKVELKKGLNVITFVLSNRFDQTTISDDNYSGTLSCLGNIDSMTLFSKANLEYVADTNEVEGADPDVALKSTKMEVEAATTRIYENKENPNVNISPKTFVEFKENMKVLFGFNSSNTLAKLSFKLASPYVNAATEMTDTNLGDIMTVTLNQKNLDLSKMTLKGNVSKGSKENFTVVETGWLSFKEGKNTLSFNIKKGTGFEYLGGLDFVDISYLDGTFTPFLAEEPADIVSYKFEAEANTTKRVGYDELATGAQMVEFKAAKKVETDKYVNKVESTKIIYGIVADASAVATVKMRVAAPYVDANTIMEDVNLGDIGDLWINDKIVETTYTLKGNNLKGTKENFTTITLETQIELRAGKNRISWEPRNYTNNNYEYLGGLDYIELETSSKLEAYEVNMWTDRHTYFDDDNNEPIYVTVDKVNESSPNSCWVGVYQGGDNIYSNSPGSIYYYYPTNTSWNSDGKTYLGTPCDVTKQNPNDKRPGISAATGGMYQIVYMEKDSKNTATGAYDVYDVITIGVWNDPVVGYDGYVK